MKPNIRSLLHDHVDGSAAIFGMLRDLYIIAGEKYPFSSDTELLEFFKNPQLNIVEKFGKITGVLQTTDAISYAAYKYGEYRAREGYIYVEGKFAPQYHIRKGLSMRDATKAFVSGFNAAENQFHIRITPIICIGREADEDLGLKIAKLACEYEGEMGLDLVCDEAKYPPERHLKAYRYTFGTKVKRDCHAGEWVHMYNDDTDEEYEARLMKNIKIALFDMKCNGIGHAIPIAKHKDLVKYVVDNGVRITGCPLSNFSSGLIKDLKYLKIDYLIDAGVSYTINPDDDLFLPPMNEVIEKCDEVYNFTKEQCEALERNAFSGAFKLTKIPCF